MSAAAFVAGYLLGGLVALLTVYCGARVAELRERRA
jgi:energy-converting hydrogenase Eha subunit B